MNGISFHCYESLSPPHCLLVHLTVFKKKKRCQLPLTFESKFWDPQHIQTESLKLILKRRRQGKLCLQAVFQFSVSSPLVLFGAQCEVFDVSIKMYLSTVDSGIMLDEFMKEADSGVGDVLESVCLFLCAGHRRYSLLSD